MKVKIENAEAGVGPYELDTVKVADRLDKIAGQIMLVDAAVGGLIDDYGLYADRASNALRELLRKLSEKVSAISDKINPEPVDLRKAKDVPPGAGS
jgi:hypothetical protein